MFELEMTDELRHLTRKWFVEQELKAMDEAKSFFSEEYLPQYLLWRQANITRILEGKEDHTFTFRQRAYYLQNGSTPALLSY